MEGRLAHVDERGAARIVDITGKEPTQRRAVARGSLRLPPSVVEAMRGTDPRTVLETARLAGIGAAKRTSWLIPLCHPIRVDDIDVALAVSEHGVDVTARVDAFERTGPEMEALVACAAALLSVAASYKHVEPKPTIAEVLLVEKAGGKSGTWVRPATGGAQAGADPHTEAS